MDQNERIDLYLTGRLQGEELDKFVLELKENAILEKEVELKAAIIDAIKESRNNQLKEYIARQTKNKGVFMLPGPTWVYAAAASVLLVAVFFFLFKEEIPKQINPIAIFQPKSDTTSDENKDEQIPVAENKENTSVDETPMVIEEELNEITNDSAQIAADDSEWTDQAGTIDDAEVFVVREDRMFKSITTEAKLHQQTLVDSAVLASRVAKKEVETIDKKPIIKNKETSPEAETVKPDFKKINQIKIEFWQSIVGFKGYQFNGKTLRLYGLDSMAMPQLHQLNGQYYMQLNKEYFQILLNDNFEPYQKISDAALIERLKN